MPKMAQHSVTNLRLPSVHPSSGKVHRGLIADSIYSHKRAERIAIIDTITEPLCIRKLFDAFDIFASGYLEAVTTDST